MTQQMWFKLHMHFAFTVMRLIFREETLGAAKAEDCAGEMRSSQADHASCEWRS